MKLLIMGGTHHVGRSVVETALARGDTVTTLNRGVSRRPVAGVEALTADRTDPDSVRAAIGLRNWDAVIDTWAQAPRVVQCSARLLAGQAGHYGYVSSPAAHALPWPPGLTEESPLVDADPSSEDGENYQTAKRGGELAVTESFADRGLFARAGMILGPYEDLQRVTWWLRRIEKGGRVLAPGPADFPLQLIDGRDLARFMLSAADQGIGGAFHVTSRPALTTVRELLETAVDVVGNDAELVWADGDLLEREGVWLGIELGIRAPDAQFAEMWTDTTKAHDAGLTCRPIREMLEDTWAWLQAEGEPGNGGLADRRPAPATFVDPAKEREILTSITR